MRVRPTPHGGGRGAPHCAQVAGGVTEIGLHSPRKRADGRQWTRGGRQVPDESRSGECKGCVDVPEWPGCEAESALVGDCRVGPETSVNRAEAT